MPTAASISDPQQQAATDFQQAAQNVTKVSSSTTNTAGPAQIQQLTTLLNNAIGAVSGAAATTQYTEKVTSAIDTIKQSAAAGASNLQELATATAAESTSNTTAALQTQNQDIYAANAVDAQKRSIALMQQVNYHTDKALAADTMATKRDHDASLPAMLFGDVTFGDFIKSHITDPASRWHQVAADEATTASTALGGVDSLQKFVTGEHQMNAALAVNLSQGDIANKATIAKDTILAQLPTLQINAAVAGANQIDAIQRNKLQAVNEKIQLADAGARVMQAQKSIDRLDIGLEDKDAMAAAIRLAGAFNGDPQDSGMTPALVKGTENNAVEKAGRDQGALMGLKLSQWVKEGATGPMPQLFSDPGEAAMYLLPHGATGTAATAPLYDYMRKISAGTSGIDPLTQKAFPAATVRGRINANYTSTLNTIKQDAVNDPLYGKIPAANVLYSARRVAGQAPQLNDGFTPEDAAILRPVMMDKTGNLNTTESVPFQQVFNAIASARRTIGTDPKGQPLYQDLTQPERKALGLKYMNMQSRLVEVLRRPNAHGFAPASTVSSHAYITTGSMLSASHYDLSKGVDWDVALQSFDSFRTAVSASPSNSELY